jgi:hypothetical protein
MKNINRQLDIKLWKLENKLNFRRQENIIDELYWRLRSQLCLKPNLQLWLQLHSQLYDQLESQLGEQLNNNL